MTLVSMFLTYLVWGVPLGAFKGWSSRAFYGLLIVGSTVLLVASLMGVSTSTAIDDTLTEIVVQVIALGFGMTFGEIAYDGVSGE